MTDKIIKALTGTSAVSEAMRQINPDVVAAYPITPQTAIVMKFSEFVSNGKVDTEFVPVESEHSAMSACVGAAASGARAMTATASAGLALMWEILYVAASNRLPIVMPVVNRALSAPINIHCDHSDTMGARDSGWIQIYCENAQEAYDCTIAAIRIAEHKDILLPVMVCQDGFITSHAMERVDVIEDKKVKDFIGELKFPDALLDTDNPVTYGPLDLFDYYFEHKRQQSEAISHVFEVADKVFEEFEKLSGRKYKRIETYRMDDAQTAIVALNSTVGTAKDIVDVLREKGEKVGILFPRMFRPFPAEEIARELSGLDAVAVLDRSETFSGTGGPMLADIKSALYQQTKRPIVMNYIYGLGGREINPQQIERVFSDLKKVRKEKKVVNINYLGVRE